MARKYSVLMSVYIKEKAQFLDESINSMLKQTIPPNDFVLVCDGPLTDELESVIDKYKKEYSDLFQIVRRAECGGLGNALNDGIKYCKYDYVARMDTDDIARKDRMERQLQAIEKENVDIVLNIIRVIEVQIVNLF